MGEIIGAGFLSHAPTIMLPQEIRYELNEGKEISLVPGLKRLRAEVFDVQGRRVVTLLDRVVAALPAADPAQLSSSIAAKALAMRFAKNGPL